MFKDLTEKILIAYAESHGKNNIFSKHHTDSYNHFIQNDLPKIIESRNPIQYKNESATGMFKKIKVEIDFRNITVEKPHKIDHDGNVIYIYPNYCRLTSTTYRMNVKAISTMKIFVSYDENKDMEIVFNHTSKEPLLLGRIPCMVGSEMCNLYGLSRDELIREREDEFEIGGYFIINGVEFMIIPQENKIVNKIFKNIDKDKNKRNEYKVWGAFKNIDSDTYPYYTEVSIDNNDQIWISVSVSKSRKIKFPLTVFYRAMGIVTDKDIFEHIISFDENADANMIDILNESINIRKENIDKKVSFEIKDVKTAADVLTQEQALYYIGRKLQESSYYKKYGSEKALISYANNRLFEEELFPQIGGLEKIEEKKLQLSKMVRSCINLRIGIEKPYDTLNYGNKDIITSGKLYGQVIRHVFINDLINGTGGIVKTLRTQMSSYNKTKNYEKFLIDHFNNKKLENVERYISTGEWPAGKTKGFNVKAGVSILMERRSRMDTIAFTQKIIVSSKKKSGGTGEPPLDVRKLHQTTFGYLDPFDTPDSPAIGLRKSKTIFSDITLYSDPGVIDQFIKKYIYSTNIKLYFCKNKDHREIITMGKIFINGYMKYCCHVESLRYIYDTFVGARRTGKINRLTSIIPDFNDCEIRLYTTAGRLIRPLFIVDNQTQKAKFTKKEYNLLKRGKIGWNWLVEHEIIEYVNIQEEKNALRVAFSFKDLYGNVTTEPDEINEHSKKNGIIYTHVEISAISIVGINVLSNPLCNYGQGPRVTFGCKLATQAIGTYAINNFWRMDTEGYTLCGPQKPLVTSVSERITNMAEMPGGYNPIVAITTYSGFNIEDSILTNQQSVDNGMFRVFAYKVKMDKLTTDKEEFIKPEESNTRFYKGDEKYKSIDNYGMPKIGATVKYGDILIGKVKKLSKSIVERFNVTSRKQYEDKSKIYKDIIPGKIERYIKTKDHNNNNLVKVKVRVLKQFQVGDKVASQCFDKNTDILTSNGWKSVKDLSMSDKVASLNIEHELIYTTIDKLHEYDMIDEDMVQVKSDLVDLLVTKNHRMYFCESDKYEPRTASDIVTMTGKYKKDIKMWNPTYHINRFMKNDKLAKFIGLYINNLDNRYKYTKYSISIDVSDKYVKEIMDNINLSYDMIKNPKEYTINNKEFYKFIIELVPDDRIPNWCYQEMNHYESNLLLYSVIRSGGLHTSKKCMVDDIQRLALHCSRSADYTYDGKMYNIINNTVENSEPKLNSSNNKIIKGFNGKVYCCTVKYGTIYVRRNGKTVWSCNSSQKGTNSLNMKAKNMPVSEDGMIPDIIFNPHGITTRMTINYIVTLALGNIATMKGVRIDGTVFNGMNINKDIIAIFNFLGDKNYGKLKMINGITGRYMDTLVNIGPIHYQRLKQMVSGKISSRETKFYSPNTRQPGKGRKRGGGFRIGQMEAQALNAHGAQRCLREKFFDHSDKFSVYVSEETGEICIGNKQDHYYSDGKQNMKISKVEMPFVFMMVKNLISVLGINMRFILGEAQ